MKVERRRPGGPARILRLFPVVCCAVLVAAPPLAAQRRAAQDLVWPAPPEVARIRYVGSLTSERDLGRRASFLSRVTRALVGGRAQRLAVVERPFDVLVEDGTRFYVTNGLRGAVLLFDTRARRTQFIGGDVPGGLVKAMGLGGDGRGEVFVADAGTRRIVVFGPDGRFRRAFGGPSVLLNPVDVAVDPVTGRAYVVDSYLHQVVIFDSTGAVERRIGRETGTLASRAARMSVADSGRAEVDGHPAAGDPSDVFENRSGEPGQFRYPVSVAVGPGGTVYVSDQLNFRVQAFDRDGRFLRQIGQLGDTPGSFTRPKGLAVDAEGHLYVVDAAFNNVQVFDEEGRLLIAFGALGHGEGEHWLPVGIAIDGAGRIVVADRYNNRVQIYQYLAAAPEPAIAAQGAPEPRRTPR